MTVEIRVPALGESVSEATVARWYKAVGEAVAADEPLVELETDKVTVEVPAATAGTLSEILAAAGTNVEVGALLGAIAAGAGPVGPDRRGRRPASVGWRRCNTRHPASVGRPGRDCVGLARL